MSKQFVVIGLGRFGGAVAEALMELGHEVLGVDRDPALVEAYQPLLTHTIALDCTDEEHLRHLGLHNFDTAVVAVGDDLQASVLICLLLKEFGVDTVIAKAATDLHGKVLTKIGADRVVFPERDMGVRVAHNLISSSVLDYIELSPDYSVMELDVPTAMLGKTLRQLDLRARFGVNVMAIKRGAEVLVAPQATDQVLAGDVLVAIGENEALRRLEHFDDH